MADMGTLGCGRRRPCWTAWRAKLANHFKSLTLTSPRFRGELSCARRTVLACHPPALSSSPCIPEPGQRRRSARTAIGSANTPTWDHKRDRRTENDKDLITI